MADSRERVMISVRAEPQTSQSNWTKHKMIVMSWLHTSGVKSAQHETATNNSPLLSSQLIDTATVLSKM